MPDRRYQPWLFGDRGVSDLVDAMVSAVERYGRPFMTQYASLESSVSLMVEGKVGIREQLAYRTRLPIGCSGTRSVRKKHWNQG
jgi:hypothetical protein